MSEADPGRPTTSRQLVRRDVVVVGASAGGVEALRQLVSGLPVDYPGTVLVVLHVPPTGSSALPQILDRAGPLPARHAREGDPLQPGQILVAPPDHHLIVFDHEVTLSRGPSENGHRPAVDVLFRTAARALGSRVVGVVLSGALDDGAAGLVAVRLRDGVAVVQDPEDALHDSMPRAAMMACDVDHVLPAAKIATLLSELAQQEVPNREKPASGLMQKEAAMADLDAAALTDPDRPGEPSAWTCPDCHGSLFEIREGGLSRYRCRVGHAWSPASLVAQQSASVETALWVALRTLEEKATLSLDLGHRAGAEGHRMVAERFHEQARDATECARLVRDLIQGLARPRSEPEADALP